MGGPALTAPLTIRQTCLSIQSLRRHFSTSPIPPATNNGSTFVRSDFSNQGFTSYYEVGGPTIGPIGEAQPHGNPRITPAVLKQHLDQFVVGQERAKKILSVAVYNHYLRIQEHQRLEEEAELLNQQASRDIARHPVEGPSDWEFQATNNLSPADEYPGQQPTVNLNQLYHQPNAPPPQPAKSRGLAAPLLDNSPLTIEKSNILLLGPSGVGKTLMAKTLARVLEVPFSMSDCTPFTQSGYIGEDAEVCVQRLLVAANYDVARAERGIICLDEIDKIATAKVSHGKDVSGEGVQQALLKIIEGTTVQISAKQERSSGNSSHRSSGAGTPNTAGPGGAASVNTTQPNKGEVYNVQTDNILFICTGAFIGLHRHIMDRIAKGSIGFGAAIRSAAALTTAGSGADFNDPTIRAGTGSPEDELFKKHLPFFVDPVTNEAESSPMLDPFDSDPPTHNTLDLVTPPDLQRYGLIPELIGRIPITCALSPLSLNALIRVLTEPRNSLVAQYCQLFALSGIELRFSTPALREVAKAARSMGTGARGLRTVMERLLGDAMFECPGSGVRYVLVTEAAARRDEAVQYYHRGQGALFRSRVADEEEAWERRRRKRADGKKSDGASRDIKSFEEYRQKITVAGSG